MRLHFGGRPENSKNIVMTCYHCHKVSHLGKNCKYRASTPKQEDIKGKSKVDVEEVRNQMGKTWWKKTEESETSNTIVDDTSSNRLGETSTSN